MADIHPQRLGYFVPKPGGTLDAAVSPHTFNQQLAEEFGTTLQVIFDVQPILQAFCIAEISFGTLETVLGEIRTRAQGLQNGPWSDIAFAHEAQLRAQQCVMAFLSSARSFRDHTLTALTRKFGKASQELLAFVAETHRLYDSHFSYRFLAQLRHMSQHVALPISTFRLHAERVGVTSKMVLDARLTLDRNALLTTWTEWKEGVRTDIRSQPDHFDLISLLKEEMGWLERLCGVAVRQRGTDLVKAAGYLKALLRIIQPPDDAVPVLWLGEPSESAPPSNFAILPLEEMRRIGAFLQRDVARI